MNEIFLPSGEQESRPKLKLPPVVWVSWRIPVPSIRIVKMFDDFGGPNEGWSKAIRDPSGDQSILSPRPPENVFTRVSPLPSTLTIEIDSPRGSPRRKAIRFPSGEKT